MVGPKQRRGLGGGWGQCSGSGKGPGGCRGVELGLKEQKGPRRAPHPWSQRAGDLTWEPSRLPGLEWVGQSPSAPLPLLPEGPSHVPLLFSPWPPSYAPKDPHGLEGALEGRGLAWELSSLPGLSGRGNRPPLLSHSSWMAPPAFLS